MRASTILVVISMSASLCKDPGLTVLYSSRSGVDPECLFFGEWYKPYRRSHLYDSVLKLAS